MFRHGLDIYTLHSQKQVVGELWGSVWKEMIIIKPKIGCTKDLIWKHPKGNSDHCPVTEFMVYFYAVNTQRKKPSHTAV